MTFLAPLFLLGLLAVPLLVGLYLLVQRRRSRYAVRFTNLDLLANIAPKRPAWRRHVPAAIYLGAIAVLVVGMARPQLVIAVPREDATVLLTIDVSGSMEATDVAPSRLHAAQEAARSFIAQLPEDIRVGIVAFASQPVTLVAPTTDREELIEAIDSLEPLDGTAMGDALMQTLDIAEAIQSDGTAPDASPAPGASGAPEASGDPGASMAPDATDDPASADDQPTNEPLVAAILLSDGANSAGEAMPLDAAQRGAQLGVPIYTIALGTADGQVTVEDQFGFPVTLDVPPDTETLARIAEITDATAFDATTAADLSSVYDSLESRVGYVEEVQEITWGLAGAALILVLVAAGLSALWFGRLP